MILWIREEAGRGELFVLHILPNRKLEMASELSNCRRKSQWLVKPWSASGIRFGLAEVLVFLQLGAYRPRSEPLNEPLSRLKGRKPYKRRSCRRKRESEHLLPRKTHLWKLITPSNRSTFIPKHYYLADSNYAGEHILLATSLRQFEGAKKCRS